MQFLCDRCKQKYHVADEKVRGRAVTRFKCKKCEHIIELRAPEVGAMESPDDGTMVGDAADSLSIVPPAPTSPPPAVAASRLPSAAPRPATGTGLPTAPRTGHSTGALPTRPATAAAATKPATAPLPSALRPAPAAAAAPRPGTGAGLAAGSRIGAATAAASPRPAPVASASGAIAPRPSTASAAPLRTAPERRTTSSASALLNASETGWYAGVRDLPVGPLTRSEVAARLESGDITPESLVWREGLDDWRALRLVDELSDLLRSASQKLSDGLLGTMGRREPSRPASADARKVVPIAQARPAPSAKGDFGADDDSDDEPTRMTSLADLVAKAESGHAPGVEGRATGAPISRPSAQPASVTRGSGSTGRHPSVAPPPPSAAMSGKHPSIRPTTAAAAVAGVAASVPPPPPAAEAVAAKQPPIAAPLLSAPVVPVGSPGALAGPSDPTASSAPFAMNAVPPRATTAITTTARSVAPPAATKQKVPVGIWIMMVGVLVVGVAVGLVVRPAGPPAAAPPPVARASVAAPSVPSAPVGRQVGAEIHLDPTAPVPAVAPPPAVPTPPVAPVVAPAAATGESAVSAHRVAPPTTAAARAPTTAPAGTSGGGVAGHTLTAAQLAQLNSALGAAPEGVAQSTGPTNSQLRNTPQASENNGGLSGAARAGQVITALQRSNVVNDCWTRARTRNPAHPPENLHVTLDVSPSGRATSVTVAGASDADLVTCIQTRSRSQFYGAGGSVAAEVSFSLVPGQ